MKKILFLFSFLVTFAQAQTNRHLRFDVYDDVNDEALSSLLERDMSNFSGETLTAEVLGIYKVADAKPTQFIYENNKWKVAGFYSFNLLSEVFDATGRAGEVVHVLGASEVGDSGAGHYKSNGSLWVKFEETRQNKKAILFLADGQSNMQGSGIKPAYEADDFPLSNFFQISQGFDRSLHGWDAGNRYDIIPARQPLQHTQDRNNSAAYASLAFYFGNEIARNFPDYDVIIIPNAFGGSSFTARQWTPEGELLRNGYDLVRSTYERLSNRYASVDFGGVIWHQGEGDTGDESNLYAERFTEKFKDQRENLSFGNFPVVVGTMLSTYVSGVESRLEVDAVHRDVANLIGNADFVNMDDLTDAQDSIHFGADDLQTAGLRYYSKYMELNNPLNSEMRHLPLREVLKLSVENGGLSSTAKAGDSANPFPKVTGRDLIFDGQSSIPFDDIMPVNKPFTKVISLDFVRAVLGESANLMSSHNGNGRLGGAMFISNSDHTLRIGRNNGTVSSVTENINYSEFYGEPVTIAVSNDGVRTTLYTQNGVLAEGLDSGIRFSDTDLSVGSFNNNNNLVARVREASVYEGVISVEELNNKHCQIWNDAVRLSDGLIGLYEFDADGSDTSGNGNDLTQGGAPTYAGGATSLNGSSDFFETPFVEAQVQSRVIRFRTSSVANTQNLISAPGGGLSFLSSGVPRLISLTTSEIATPNLQSDFRDGNYHTLIINDDREAGFTTYYIDGIKLNGASLQAIGSNPIFIGSNSNNGSATNRLQGDIDFVRIYDRALNFNEIKELSTN